MEREDRTRLDTGSTGRFVGRFDWQETSPKAGIVEAVARATDRNERELGVLYEHVDPDALDRLFENSGTQDSIELSFIFDGLRVTVREDGSVFVEPDG